QTTTRRAPLDADQGPQTHRLSATWSRRVRMGGAVAARRGVLRGTPIRLTATGARARSAGQGRSRTGRVERTEILENGTLVGQDPSTHFGHRVSHFPSHGQSAQFD